MQVTPKSSTNSMPKKQEEQKTLGTSELTTNVFSMTVTRLVPQVEHASLQLEHIELQPIS